MGAVIPHGLEARRMPKLFFFSSMGARGAPLFASAVAHVAIVAAATGGGHGQGRGARAAQEISVDLLKQDLPPSPAPETPGPAPEAQADRTPAIPPHHTHPYPVPPDHDARPHDPSVDHRLANPLSGPTLPTSEPAAAPAVETSSAPPHFAIVVGRASSSPGGLTQQAADGTSYGRPPPPSESNETAVPEAAVSSPARLVSSVRPTYPPAARSAGVEADVLMEIVLGTEGAVQDAHVVRRAGFGFDEAALSAIRSYRFSPALREGRPVRVRMRWRVEFRLD